MVRVTDDTLMYFGTYRSVPLGRVPDSYWIWFLKQKWCDKYPELVEYANIVSEDADD